MTDLTSEFMSIVAMLPPPAASSTRQKDQAPAVSTLTEFHGASSAIAKDIHITSQKLRQLTKLVQSRGLFNDPAEEINLLVHDIKQGIQGLNSQLDVAQAYVDGRKAKMAGGAQGQHANHSVNVVGQLKAELMNTTKEFKDVLQVRSSKLKEQAERKDMFFTKQSAVSLGRPAVYKPIQSAAAAAAAAAAHQSSLPLTLPPPPKGGAWSDSPNGVSGYTTANNSSSSSSSSSSNRHMLPRPGVVTSMPDAEQSAEDGRMSTAITPLIPQRQQQLSQMQLIPDQSYLESRTSAMQDVESHIVELGSIFNRLASMLQDQREMVESVHDNVEDAEANVNRGQLALMATLRSLQSNRLLAAKVSGVLILFVLFFIIFVA